MSGPAGSQHWMYNAGGSFYDYTIDQSLRLNRADSAHLYKTWGADADSSQIFTFSIWVKRHGKGDGSNDLVLIQSKNSGSGTGQGSTLLGFYRNSELLYYTENGGRNARSKALFRDPGAWMHLCWQYDSTQSTAEDRIKIYVNGVHLESGSTNWTSAGFGFPEVPALNSVMTSMNQNTQLNAIGAGISTTINYGYFDGYIAEVIMLDGITTDCTSFGEFSGGVWVPKEYSGSFGTNGYHLDFADSSAIGNDVSGNNNDWTPSGLAASDVVLDSPTNNFATYNPIYKNLHQNILTQGNLQNDATSNYFGTGATIAVKTGKWYCEVNMVARSGISNIGIDDVGGTLQKEAGYGFAVTSGNYGVALLGNDGKIQNNAVDSQTGLGALSTGDIIGMALDLDSATKTIQFYKNNVAYGTAETISDSAPTGEFVFGSSGHNASTHVINFGQDSTFAGNETAGGNADANGIGDFFYAPPSGFLALCTSNLSESTIGPNSGVGEQADDYFNTVLYTGDGTNGQAITGVGHQPDFLWIKSRSGTAYHELHDSVRGAGKRLFSNDTAAESDVGTVSSFDSDGFTVSRNSAYDGTNQSSVTFVGWSWKAGGAASSNSNGSITSSVSANQDAGFSIVSYTGTGSNATVGHGLSSAPELVIVKERDGTGQWSVQSTGLSAANEVLHLQNSNGEASKADHFNSTFPTSTVFSVGTSGNTNGNTHPFIAYCFHSVEGYCKVGVYEGNSNADGTFVYTGFRPAWIMVKEIDASGFWMIQDNKIYPFNDGDTRSLAANDTGTESTISGRGNEMDILSNGFKMRASTGDFNAANTHIYLAFAEAPFKYANAR